MPARSPTRSLERWFRGSKVVDENGEPLVVWHGHPRNLKEFYVFDFDRAIDFGMHFGSKAAAEDLGAPRPFYLSLKNPMVLTDPGDWISTGLGHANRWSKIPALEEIHDRGYISREVYDAAKDAVGAIQDEYQTAHKMNERRIAISRLLREIALQHGYDGVVYQNLSEDRGSLSWIAFRPEQIKLADGSNTTFDPEDADMRKNPRRRSNPTLLDIPGVEAVVDTANIRSSDDAYAFGNAASYEDGVGLVAWHVTDDPTGILKKIERKADFKKAYGDKRSELGPGLYVSAVPHIWTGRARNKWSFLAALTDDEKAAILALLHKDLARLFKRAYLSDHEHKYALRLLDDAETENNLESARSLAGQPYNIKWSDPEWLAEASESAAMKATPPQAVKVALRGRFAQLARSYPAPDVLRALRRAGFAGAFTRGGMGSNAELVVFHGSSLTPLAVETV